MKDTGYNEFFKNVFCKILSELPLSEDEKKKKVEDRKLPDFIDTPKEHIW